jgi:hypothetical protein
MNEAMTMKDLVNNVTVAQETLGKVLENYDPTSQADIWALSAAADDVISRQQNLSNALEARQSTLGPYVVANSDGVRTTFRWAVDSPGYSVDGPWPEILE